MKIDLRRISKLAAGTPDRTNFDIAGELADVIDSVFGIRVESHPVNLSDRGDQSVHLLFDERPDQTLNQMDITDAPQPINRIASYARCTLPSILLLPSKIARDFLEFEGDKSKFEFPSQADIVESQTSLALIPEAQNSDLFEGFLIGLTIRWTPSLLRGNYSIETNWRKTVKRIKEQVLDPFVRASNKSTYAFIYPETAKDSYRLYETSRDSSGVSCSCYIYLIYIPHELES